MTDLPLTSLIEQENDLENIQISVAISLDGYLGDRTSERLILSSKEDFEDMYTSRALADAILVGAETVRRDNPSLLFHRPYLIAQRVARGQTPELTKVTVTASGELNPQSKFFSGDTRKIVLCPIEKVDSTYQRLGQVAEVLGLPTMDPPAIVRALEETGVQRLFIEGGTTVLTQFLSTGTFDRVRIAIAPFFVADEKAPRLVGTATFLNDKNHRLRLLQVRMLGDMAVMDLEKSDDVR